jgi:DNA-binding MarR family transcriptional regulator
MVNSGLPVGYVLKRAQSLLHIRMEEALKPFALTVTQYSCLYQLRREPGISAAALARATFVTRQSMNATLLQLLDRKLVTRPSQAESGRALPAILTATGNETLDSAQTEVERVQERMVGGLSERDRDALADALASCAEALELPAAISL